MSIWIPGILMTYGAFLFAVASPGPNVLAVMGVSMSDGRKAGIALAFGIAAGSLRAGKPVAPFIARGG